MNLKAVTLAILTGCSVYKSSLLEVQAPSVTVIDTCDPIQTAVNYAMARYGDHGCYLQAGKALYLCNYAEVQLTIWQTEDRSTRAKRYVFGDLQSDMTCGCYTCTELIAPEDIDGGQAE